MWTTVCVLAVMLVVQMKKKRKTIHVKSVYRFVVVLYNAKMTPFVVICQIYIR